MSFTQLTTPVEIPYGSDILNSKYQGQKLPTASLFHKDFEK
jgi:deoxycytidine triphosphate deaminase